MHVDVAELREHVQRQRPRVVHVEHGGGAVGDDDSRVADRAVGRGARDDHHVQVALGTAQEVLDGVLRLEEPVEAELVQFPLEVGHREVGQQHYGVLVDVLGEQLGIEVVLVQVRCRGSRTRRGLSQFTLLSGNTNHEPK